MTFEDIRITAIVALFSSDDLVDRIVLKGGNAISLIHKIGSRTSLDLDFSIDGDFEDMQSIGHSMEKALNRQFRNYGYSILDFKFTRKPRVTRQASPDFWGGYKPEFKLTLTGKARTGTKRQLQRSSEIIGPHQKRIFSIDFSKHEYVAKKQQVEIMGFDVYVYPPEMLVAEKLRALCQQLPDYPHNNRPRARARDFYDIHELIERSQTGFPVAALPAVLQSVFKAKEVDIALLDHIQTTRDFHVTDWDAVVESVRRDVEGFDYYFDYVIRLISELRRAWDK
jgi:predicted nucleotidyltransferase component of viral defense system